MKRINHTSSGENLIGILMSISIGISLILLDAGRTSAHGTQSLLPTDFNSYRIKVQQIYTSQIGVREKDINAGPHVEKYLRYVNLSKGQPWCAAFVCWVLGQAGVGNPRSGWSPELFGEGRIIWVRGEENGKLKTESGVSRMTLVSSPTGSGISLWHAATAASAWSLCRLHTNRDDFRSTLDIFNLGTFKFRVDASSAVSAGDPRPSRGTAPYAQPDNRQLVAPTTGDIFGLYFSEKGRIAHVGFIDQWDGTWMISVEGNTNESGSREGDGVYRKRRLIRSIYKVARYIR